MAKKNPLGKLQPGDKGYVGRGHPPEHGKILPGETRNPWGRYGKEGKPAKLGHFAAVMAEELKKPVPGKDGKSYTREKLAVNAVTMGMVAGDMRSVDRYLAMVEKFFPASDAGGQDKLELADEEILARYERQILLSAGVDPDALDATANPRSVVGEDGKDAEDV